MGRDEAGRVLQVLHADGDAGQGTGITSGGHHVVDLGRRFERARLVDGHEGVDGAVEGIDALEGVGHELTGGGATGPDVGGQIGHGDAAKVHGPRRSTNLSPLSSVRPGRQVEKRDGNLGPMSSSAVAGPSVVTATVLDHVAVAVERWTDAWPRYVDQLGGTWHSGGVNVGFSPAQLSFANGAKVEVLQPWEPEANPFLRRFLDHNGPGPHHLTFKVPDIDDALVRVRGAGFEPVGVRLDDPQWREAFLHPRQAFGVVVQVAQEQFEWMAAGPRRIPHRLGRAGRRPAARDPRRGRPRRRPGPVRRPARR